MAQWWWRVAVSRVTWVLLQQVGETLCRQRAQYVALSPSVHWHACFYIAALSIRFFLGFRQWRSRADRVLPLYMNIWLPLFWTHFWSTWSRARGPDSGTCVCLAHGRDFSYCRASEQKWQKKAWLLFCLELSKKTWKQWLMVKSFNPHPQDSLKTVIKTLYDEYFDSRPLCCSLLGSA